MRIQLKQYTEPIFSLLAEYRTQLVNHPLLTAAHEGELSSTILHEFAFFQYSDSILWIPMLAQMKSKTERSRRLRKAIEDNIAHEAGIGSVSHVTLAIALMRSLGITDLESYHTETFRKSAALWLSDEFNNQTEPEIAGWLLTAETLVPLMSPRSNRRSRSSAPIRCTFGSTSPSIATSTPRGWRRRSRRSSSSTAPRA